LKTLQNLLYFDTKYKPFTSPDKDMSEGSVNVESRTSSQDKRWTIMAALLGTNTAVMLFQGIEQESNPTQMREVALAIIAATLPFQAIYFLIYTFLLENKGTLSERMVKKLNFASAICQIFGYISLVGVAILWYNLSIYVGISFLISSIFAMILIRTAMMPDKIEQ
tara:strand:- start:158 stop:655 length:498 start_codon:yes stop_codon:yes gene_type:complete